MKREREGERGERDRERREARKSIDGVRIYPPDGSNLHKSSRFEGVVWNRVFSVKTVFVL